MYTPKLRTQVDNGRAVDSRLSSVRPVLQRSIAGVPSTIASDFDALSCNPFAANHLCNTVKQSLTAVIDETELFDCS